MPDQEGNLLGDKATGALMDNSKIKRAVPDFVCTTSFAQGVRQSVAYFRAHPKSRPSTKRGTRPSTRWWRRMPSSIRNTYAFLTGREAGSEGLAKQKALA